MNQPAASAQSMTPLTRRLANDWRLFYLAAAELLVLVDPAGGQHVRGEVKLTTLAKLLRTTDPLVADRQVEAICDLHFELPERRSRARLRQLADELAAQAGRAKLRVSKHNSPLPLQAYVLDEVLERELCARDADCGGTGHRWIWTTIDDEDFIYHFDWQHGTAVPPTPLEVLWG